ncbi:MAG: response regulator transcription factor [Prosthecobacter sp.]|nr:response regulator transcription factor [Prosthecobacter sp.]
MIDAVSNPVRTSPTAETVTRVLVVDDHPVFRYGVAMLLQEQKDFEVCGEADEAQSALAAFRNFHPHLVVTDISLPGIDGIELTKMMVSERPDIAVLIFSMHDESLYALRALRAGAKGYVRKDQPLPVLLDAIHKVLDHGIYVSQQLSDRLIFQAIQAEDRGTQSPLHRLSDRELEVFQWLGKGLGTREIADTLNLSVKTVETHRAHIKEKLGMKNSNETVRFALEWQMHVREP